MHLPAAELEALHDRLAAAVRPAGTLLVVAHHPDDLHANVGRTGRPDMFRSAEQLAASLDPGEWEIRVASAIGRSALDLDGRPVTVRDTVLRAARGPDRTGTDPRGPDRTGIDPRGPDRTGPDRTGTDRTGTGPSRTDPGVTVAKRR